MGGHVFKKISGQFDCIFGEESNERKFSFSYGKSFLQCEFIASRWITDIVGHSNQAGDFTAPTQ